MNRFDPLRKKDDGTGSGKVKPSDVKPAITQKKLRALMSSARSVQKDVSSLVGTHREQIADAVENHHLHKGAFAVIKRLDRLEPEKLADFLDCLDHYRDISGLDDRAASAPKLAMGDEFPAPAGESED